MNRLPDKSHPKSSNRVFSRVDTLREDLERALGIVINLGELSEAQLENLALEDQLQIVHQCLRRFEARCLIISLTQKDYEDAVPFDDEVPPSKETNANWQTIRSDARRANELANQLTSTLVRLHSGLGRVQGQSSIPQDISQLSQSLGNAVNELATEWNHGAR